MDEETVHPLEEILTMPGAAVGIGIDRREFHIFHDPNGFSYGPEGNLDAGQFIISYNSNDFSHDPKGYLAGHIEMYDRLQRLVSKDLADVSKEVDELAPSLGLLKKLIDHKVLKARAKTGNDQISAEQILQGMGTVVRLLGGQEMLSSLNEMFAETPDFESYLKGSRRYFDRAGVIFDFGTRFFENQYAQRRGISEDEVYQLRQCQQKAQGLSELCSELSSKYNQMTGLLQVCTLLLAHFNGIVPTK